MKTLADIRRRATVGTRLQVIEQTKRPVLVGSVRTITQASSGQVYKFTSNDADSSSDDEYRGEWPKASTVRIIDADTFEYDLPHPGNGHTIRLRFLPTAATEFPSIDAFYDDRPERRHSGEADFGLHWHVHRRSRFPSWRVSYIQATGEIYAAQLLGSCPVRVLGVVPSDPVEEHEVYYRTLDKILDGWADLDVSGFDLAWVERRLAEHAAAGQ